METATNPDLAKIPLDELEKVLATSPGGLTGPDAARRLEIDGPNEVADNRRSTLRTLVGYFWAPIPWMIEAALVLSVAAGHWLDAAVIGALLAMNVAVAFVEEHQAANAVAALRSRLAATARVRRDGSWLDVPARELVVGDLIHLALGAVVPADARLVDGSSVQLDQSALTGESLPVPRAVGDVLFSGAVMTRGTCDALVFATGPRSFFGRTTALVAKAGTVSHLQRAVLRIGRYLIVLAAVLIGITAAVSLARGDGALDTLQFALVVAIASVPVALPAVLSVTMAVGARQLARRQAVVSHLPAVEELGGIDVLCSDKTGTLTQNRLAVAEPWPVPDGDVTALLQAAVLASRDADGDPIDLAIIAAGAERGVSPAGRVREFTPFDPVAKRSMARIGLPDGREISVAKGAPQVIVALCAGDPAVAATEAQAVAFARGGYRSLGVARTEADGRWRLLGLVPLADPPRPDSADTVVAARELGIDVKMVTGDQLPIAAQVAAQVHLGTHILAADVLDPDAADPGDPGHEGDMVDRADGFAQVFPQHKYRIVELLQRRGHIVAMTGDGVNDAPALKQADAGVAVAGATDAARAAADVVLLAPGLSVIVDAIRLAREIFARMTGYAIYRIAETIRILLLITISILAFNFFPVTAIMIVLLAVLNDAAVLSIAYDHVRGARRPASWDMRTVLTLATVLGTVGVVASFALFALADTVFGMDHDVIRSLIYLKLSVAGHLTVFVTRTRGPFWSRPRPSALLAGAVLGTQALATVIAATGLFMTPIGWARAGIVWVYALAWFLVNDRVKLATYRWLDAHGRERPDVAGGTRGGGSAAHSWHVGPRSRIGHDRQHHSKIGPRSPVEG